jgi:hypothetical protein
VNHCARNNDRFLLLAVRLFNLFRAPVLLTTNATPILFYRYTILCDVTPRDWVIGVLLVEKCDRLISKVQIKKKTAPTTS